MVMANSSSPHWEGVEDESPPLHPTEKEKRMAMVIPLTLLRKVRADGPSPLPSLPKKRRVECIEKKDPTKKAEDFKAHGPVLGR